MNINMEKYNTMDYVLGQLRAMLQDGAQIEDALKSLETESTLGRHNELLMMKQYADAALLASQPKRDRILEKMGFTFDETETGEGC